VWERGVLLLSVICHLALLWRLWREGLARPYPFLTLYLVADLAQVVLVIPIRPESPAYRIIYFASNPVIWLFAYFVVVELYRLILEDYPGISSAGRRAVTGCLILAVLVSGLTVLPSLQSPQTGSDVTLKIFYNIERSVILGLLVFLVLIQLFLARYRLRLSRNRILYSVGYALYFGIAMAADIILAELHGGAVYAPVTLVIVVVADLILVGGALLLTRQGESRPATDLDDTSSERLRLQHQLAEMNRLLSRAARG